jgi:urease accessory protein
MLRISQRLPDPDSAAARGAMLQLVLPFELRCRSRFRAQLAGGEEVGVLLARGQILRGGDLLLADDGRVVEIAAAPERVSTVRTRDARLLARVAYHLGNRHVALQVGDSWLRYCHDHVLDDMVRGLGAEPAIEQAPFEPEAGAYHGGHGEQPGHAGASEHAAGEQAHDHGHDHEDEDEDEDGHGHGHDHEHEHEHPHGH